MLNHINLMGRLTRDPELKYTQNKTAVVAFTLAVDRDYGAKGEDRQTDFINCIAWRNTAEFVNKYFRKGKMAIVDGRLQTRTYTDKNDVKKTITEVVANSVYFGESKAQQDKAEALPEIQQQQDYQSTYYGFSEIEDDGTLPF